MNPLTEKLAEEALTLPDDDRVALVDVLLRSLHSPAREEIGRLWAEEAERRVQEIEDATVELLDEREVSRAIRNEERRDREGYERCPDSADDLGAWEKVAASADR